VKISLSSQHYNHILFIFSSARFETDKKREAYLDLTWPLAARRCARLRPEKYNTSFGPIRLGPSDGRGLFIRPRLLQS